MAAHPRVLVHRFGLGEC